MTTAYLIRHGELEYTYNNRGQRMAYGPDIRLSDNGKSQITLLAIRLQKEGRVIDRVYTSPFIRAKESAQIIADAYTLETPRVVENLKDIDNSHVIGTMTMDEILARGGDFGSEAQVESIQECAKRVKDAFDQICLLSKDFAIAIVSHGDAIRSLVYALEHPSEKVPSINELTKSDYIDKGEVWRLVLNDSFRLIEKEYIGRPPTLWGKGERKS